MDRPREKLAKKGPSALSDFELIKAIVGSGGKTADVNQISKDIQKLLKSGVDNLNYDNLSQIKGLGSAKISEILAAVELISRFDKDTNKPVISSAEDVADLVSEIRDKKQEYFVCLTLDGAYRLISKRVITVGTLTSSLVHPREVFADAITDRAAGIIVVHNHPSGILKPSTQDLIITKRLREVGRLIGIELIDHIVVTLSESVSIINEQPY